MSLYRLVDKVVSIVQSCSISLQSDSANVNDNKMEHVSLAFEPFCSRMMPIQCVQLLK